MDEVRTTAMLVRDLLGRVVDDEWSGQINTACHCHPEYVPCCTVCKNTPSEEHLSDCRWLVLVKEARAFLEAENVLAEARYAKGEDEEDQSVWIP